MTGPADSTSVRGEGVARAERFLLILVIWYRTLHVLDQVAVVPTLLDRYRWGSLALIVVGTWFAESGWLLRRAWRHGAYNQRWLVAADVCFTALIAFSAAWTGPPLPPVPTYAPGVAHAAALGAGAAARKIGTALLPALILSIALVSGLALGARDSGQAALKLPLDAAIIPLALAVAAALLAREVIRSGRALDAARASAVRREAELTAEQERTRTARELHDRVLQTLETVARGSEIDDDALRDQARKEAERLRQFVRTTPTQPDQSDVAVGEGSADQGRIRAERSLLLGYVLFRGASLVFVLLVPIALGDFRWGWLALAVAVTCVLEAGLVLRTDFRRRSHGRRVAIIDLAFGCAGLVVNVWLMRRANMAPFMAIFVMGAMLGAGVAFERGIDVVRAGILVGGVYMVALGLRFGSSALFEPLTRDAVWFVGWGLIAWLLARELRNAGQQIDRATAEAVRSAKEVAVEQERTRNASWLAMEVLPTLDALADGTALQDEAVRLRAQRASTWLQAFVQGRAATAASNVVNALRDTVRVHADSGFTIDLNVAGMWVGDASFAPPERTVEALSGAVNEALENVRKHAGVAHAVIRATPELDGILVTVVDEGAGFDPGHTPLGFGISQSIVGRVADAGGEARVESSPGGGTRVVILLPP